MTNILSEKIVTILSSSTYSAAAIVYTSGVAVGSYNKGTIRVTITAESGTSTLDLIIQTSINNTTWTTHTTLSQITSTGVYEYNITNFGQYIRIGYTVGGTSFTFGITGTFSNSRRQVFVDAISSLVYGEKYPLGESEKIIAVNMSVKEHSKNKPKIRTEDVTGIDNFEYKCSTYLRYWIEGFSRVTSVEYEIDDTDETPDILDEEQWLMYQKDDGTYLRFLEDIPDTDEEFRVNYLTLHLLDDNECTINSFDEEPLQLLAASYFCLMLSTAYSPTNDSTISADSVNHRSKASEFNARSKTYRSLYYNMIGVAEGENPPVSLTVDWDATASWQEDWMTHPRRYR